MAAERPTGERLAALETLVGEFAQDRRDQWEAINALRHVPGQVGAIDAKVGEMKEAFGEKLEKIEELCKSKEGRIMAVESRVDVAKGERNVVVGIVALACSILGSVATWAVERLLGQIFKT